MLADDCSACTVFLMSRVFLVGHIRAAEGAEYWSFSTQLLLMLLPFTDKYWPFAILAFFTVVCFFNMSHKISLVDRFLALRTRIDVLQAVANVSADGCLLNFLSAVFTLNYVGVHRIDFSSICLNMSIV